MPSNNVTAIWAPGAVPEDVRRFFLLFVIFEFKQFITLAPPIME